ncbi:hypothetical protein Bca101_047901 [Brassica carinata]
MCFSYFFRENELSMSPKLGDTYEGKLDNTLPEETIQILQENEIYQLQYFSLLENTQRYKLTTQQYIIEITKSTTIIQIEEKVPMMPLTTFHPLRYKQFTDIATATNYLPVRSTYIYSHISCGSKIVRLTLMDNVAAQCRNLHSMTVMKYKVVLITSINPRVFKGKLILTTTPATRFYCVSTIDLIQSYLITHETEVF